MIADANPVLDSICRLLADGYDDPPSRLTYALRWHLACLWGWGP